MVGARPDRGYGAALSRHWLWDKWPKCLSDQNISAKQKIE